MYKIICNIPNLPDIDVHSLVEQVSPEADPKFVQLRDETHKQAAIAIKGESSLSNATISVGTGLTRFTTTQDTLIHTAIDYLGLDFASPRYQSLAPGKCTMLHLDPLYNTYLKANIEKIPTTHQELAIQNPLSIARFLVMLEDSMPGQTFLFGEEVLHSWKRGDVVYWDWTKVVHGASNFGFWNRPVLRLDGFLTEKTKSFIC